MYLIERQARLVPSTDRHTTIVLTSTLYFTMILKVLPVAALATAAAAACPLSVQIVDTEAHVAHAAITNTGSETLAVFKGNTILSDHPTKDLLVNDGGKIEDFLRDVSST